MSAVNPERKPNIFGALSTPELLHNRIMDIFQVAAQNNSDADILEINAQPDDGEVDAWLYVTGKHGEDEILLLGSDNKLNYLAAEIYHIDEYTDSSGLGRDADGRSADISRVDHMAELTRRSIEVLFNVKDFPGPMYDHDDKIASYQNGWQVTYDADSGWGLHFWREKGPEVAGRPENWVEPTKEEMEYLRLILDHAARKVSGQT